jgi:hypothetical protein
MLENHTLYQFKPESERFENYFKTDHIKLFGEDDDARSLHSNSCSNLDKISNQMNQIELKKDASDEKDAEVIETKENDENPGDKNCNKEEDGEVIASENVSGLPLPIAIEKVKRKQKRRDEDPKIARFKNTEVFFPEHINVLKKNNFFFLSTVRL